MGIKNLHKFLEQHITNKECIKNIETSVLEDRVIVYDVSIFLYQFICAIRNSSTDLYSIDGQVITHIKGLITKIFGILKQKILPIFVFDGKPPEMKNQTLDIRNDKKSNANNTSDVIRKKIHKLSKELKKMPETIEEVNLLKKQFEEYTNLQKELRKSMKTSTGISKKQIDDCVELLQLLGMPHFIADGEADPYCAELVKSKVAFAVSTEDMDLLSFGATRMIRKLKSNGSCTMYNLDLILSDLKLSYEQFVDVCILLGCDYTCTITGLGMKNILKQIHEHKSIEGIIASKKYSISSEFNYIGAREQFFSKKQIPIKCQWLKPDYNGISDFLRIKFAFDEDDIGQIIHNLKMGYYSVITGEKTISQFKKDCRAIIKENISMDSDED